MTGQESKQKDDTGVSSAIKDGAQTTTKRNVASKDKSSVTQPETISQAEEFDEDDDEEFDEDSDGSDSSGIDDIPEQEKWRLIKESGIIEQINANDDRSKATHSHGHHHHKHDDAERDYIFEGIFFSIPTTCLFVVMDILVHRQFGETYGGSDIFHKVIKIFPAILIMVYFSNKSKNSKFTQAAMFVISALCGCYFLHTMHRSPAMGIMLRAPGIITILVYCIVQLNLLPAMISLVICGLYYKFGNGFVYPTETTSTDTDADSSTAESNDHASNPYSSNNSNKERIIVQSAPTMTLSVPTVSLNNLQPPTVTMHSDSDKDSDSDSDAKIANPYKTAASRMAPPVMTLSTADEPEDHKPVLFILLLVESTPSFPALDGPQRLAACSTDPKSKRRIKFALAPGHSPLDWARLTNSGTNLRGVTTLGRYSLADVKEHNTSDDAWTVLNGKVYNITAYLPFHPGGEKEVLRCAGRDGTRLFNLTHKWVNYEYMLKECQVGFLVSEASTSNKLRV
ncbi:hypothetical protein BG011_008111 [Mortierella polycephala]|uniref:Cytochrome b5 heme-binding domain-containing protein n=1 Tax=Mortierella polycephala TaxID=41804 RepID=A0A9P6PQK8_9FUNG|nr:hypothetical protein BG011_008111 [Mortierella polycephala]